MIHQASVNGSREQAGSAGEARFGTRALEALQVLLARYLFEPAVTLLDVGVDPGTGSMVLQVHVRSPFSWSRLDPPEDVNGIPVRAVVSDDEVEG